MTPPVPQIQQPPQAADPSAMLSAMGGQQPGVQPGQDPNSAATEIQNQFVDLETVLQHMAKGVADLAGQYPAFQPHAQRIGQALGDVHDSLNKGMMDSIQQLRSAQPQTPPTGY